MTSKNTSVKLTRNFDEAFPPPQYVENFKRLKRALSPPTANGGEPSVRPRRLPELLENPSLYPSLFERHGHTQYRGSLQSTALANAGALHDALSNHQPRFLLKRPHQLSKCLTHTYHKMTNGRTMIIKDNAPKFTSPRSQADRDLPAMANGTGDNMSASTAAAFERSDKKIGLIAQRVLPDMPHLVSVPTKNPYNNAFPYENRNTPFEEWELKGMQHMTLLNASRGVAWLKGDWQHEYDSVASPYSGPRSGTATPRSERDPGRIRTKMSLADYKAGRRPTSSSQAPQPAIPAVVRNGQTSSAVGAVSPTQQMIDQIIEGSAPKLADRFTDRPPQDNAPPPQPLKRPTSPPARDIWRGSPAPLQKPERQAEEGRVLWPPSNVPDWKQAQERVPAPVPIARPKRSDYASEPTHPQHPLNQQKRQKLDHNRSLKAEPVAAAKSPLSSAAAAKPAKSSVAAYVATDNKTPKQQQVAATSAETSSAEKKSVSSLTKHRQQLSNGSNTTIKIPSSPVVDRMPPLLSPLPPGLVSPNERDESTDITMVNGFRPNHIALPSSKIPKAEGSRADLEISTTSPVESPLEMPTLLSPLPEWWMQEIATAKEAIAGIDAVVPMSSAAANTVGARRERSRQPDAPGVARKTTKAQAARSAAVKESAAESANSNTVKTNKASGELPKDRLIVKLKYGKRNIKTIGRILQMKARPAAEGKTPRAPASVAPPPPPASEMKKHPRQSDDHNEPSTKRPKSSTNLEVQRARTPLTPSAGSPAASGQTMSQKGSFTTPKKGEGNKSVAMRKVESSDGRVQTPHAASTSTPASAEKSKAGPTDKKFAEIEAFKATNARYTTLGTTLKRRADQILKTKERNPGPVSAEDKMLGAVLALESATAYMIAFHAYDTHRMIERKLNTGDSWKQFFAFMNFATERAKPHGELYALAILLNGICRDALERVYIGRAVLESSAPATGTGQSNTTPEFYQDMNKNCKARLDVWVEYQKLAQEFPDVGFAITPEAGKARAMTVLKAFCERAGVPWQWTVV